MSKNVAKKIEEQLTRVPGAEPPEGLLQRIREAIPEHLPAEPEEPARPRWWASAPRLQLVAASLFVVVVGGVLAYRVVERAPRPAEQLSQTVDEAAPRALLKPEVAEAPRPEGEEAEASQIQVGTVGRAETGLETGGKVEPPLKVPAAPPARQETAFRESRAVGDDRRLRETGRRDADQELDTLATDERLRKVEFEAKPQPESKKVPGPPPAEADTEPERQKLRDALEERLGQMQGAGSRARVAAPEGRVMAQEMESRVGPPTADELPPTAAMYAPPPSTGGTHEPNDRPYGDMFFRPYGTNPFVDTEDDRFSTFGLDVDTGAYTLARGYLERGHRPPPEAVRVEEFVNYFDYGDPAPRSAEFAVTAEGAPSPFAQGPRYQMLRFNLRAREVRARERKPAVLTFVVDVSGSMGRENRLGLVQRSLELLLDELRREDRVGLVVYGSRGRVLLEPSNDRWRLRQAIERLRPGGSTNAEEGLVLGYRLASSHFRGGAINRVILCSDGVANVGRTGPESILQRIEREAERGIELTAVGFGMGNYNDVLMEQLADRGDGNYAYVDTLEEARRVFVENLTGTLQTIAADAKVQVEFNPEVVSRYRLLGYENRDIADRDFRNDAVDAGEIGAGHQVTALYEIKLRQELRRSAPLATLRLRYRSRETGRVVELERTLRRRDLAGSWQRGSPALKLASVVAQFAEILKGSYWAKEESLEELLRHAREAEREWRGEPAVRELVDLIERAARGWSEPEVEPAEDGWDD